MEKTLTEDFNSFINTISLDKKLKQDIIDKHTSLTNMIKKEHPDKYVIDRTRISGSYGKNIEIKEFDSTKNPDVDIVVLINTDENDVDRINEDFFKFLNEKKKNVVQEVRQQSNSIGLKYKNIDVDIVLARDKNDNVIEIASNKKHEWIESNCLKQVDYINEKSQKYTSFSYKELMKLFKYLNKEVLNNSIKSYTLEMLVHQCIPNNRVGLRIWMAFSETLGNISNLKNIDEIYDCCDPSKNGFDEADIEKFRYFKEEISTLYQKSLEALNGNRKIWEEIFGNRFPKQPDQVVENKDNYDKKQTPWCR